MPRIAAFWFLYMSGMGLVFPFQAIWFRENAGLSGTQLGMVLAMRPIMGMICQPIWAQLADRTGSRRMVLTGLTLANAMAYLALPAAGSFPALLLAMGALSIFGTSIFPMGTAVSMAAIGDRAAERFGPVRAFGTVGYTIVAISFPFALDAWQRRGGWAMEAGGPSEPGLEIIFFGAAAFTMVASISAGLLPDSRGMRARSRRGDLRALLAHGPYRRLVAFTFAAFFALQGPILMFPLFIRSHGGSLDTVAQMWIPMLLVEIPLVAMSGRFLRRFGPRALVTCGVAADGLRWFACSWVDDLRVIFGLQLLHGAVIAGLTIGTALYAESVVPERLRASAQGFMAMLGYSMAGALSSLWVGATIDAFGIDVALRTSGLIALMLAVSAPWILGNPTRLSESNPRGEHRIAANLTN